MKRLLQGLVAGGCMFLLMSCGLGGVVAPVITGGADFYIVENGFEFVPEGTENQGVIVSIKGQDVLTYDENDNCVPTTDVVECYLGVVSEPTRIEVSGKQLSAIASYQKSGSTLGYYVPASKKTVN